MKIKCDKRKWIIRPVLPDIENNSCPFVDYPYNIHRCNHPNFLPNRHKGKDVECNMDICPIKVD